MDLVQEGETSLIVDCAKLRIVVTHDPGVIAGLARRPAAPSMSQLVVHGYGGTDRAREFLRAVGAADRWRPFVRGYDARLVTSGALRVARLPVGNAFAGDLDSVIGGWPDLDAVLLSDDYFALAMAAIVYSG